MPRDAVLFKVHFWDDFVTRQMQRLCRNARTADVFVVVDETRGPVHGITHSYILRVTEADAVAAGYFNEPEGSLFWYNTDYQLYLAAARLPDYDYYVTCEYDCAVLSLDIAAIVARMEAESIEFVGEPINRSQSADWWWATLAAPYYPPSYDLGGRSLCFAIFSARITRALSKARLEHGARRRAAGSGLTTWPNNEAFVGAELQRLGAAELPLSVFGDMAHYRWAPTVFEPLLTRLAAHPLIHPVLTGRRFIESVLRRPGVEVTDLFRPGTDLHAELGDADASSVIRVFLEWFLEGDDYTAIKNLAGYAAARGAPENLLNIAFSGVATQSSVSVNARGKTLAQDAAFAICGVMPDDFAFHTDDEARPWWQVDLQHVRPIRAIKIFNRRLFAECASHLSIITSLDGVEWKIQYVHPPEQVIIEPLLVAFPAPCPARFIRLLRLVHGVLHLRQVEIYV